MGKLTCAFVVRIWQKTGFLMTWPILLSYVYWSFKCACAAVQWGQIFGSMVEAPSSFMYVKSACAVLPGTLLFAYAISAISQEPAQIEIMNLLIFILAGLYIPLRLFCSFQAEPITWLWARLTFDNRFVLGKIFGNSVTNTRQGFTETKSSYFKINTVLLRRFQATDFLLQCRTCVRRRLSHLT